MASRFEIPFDLVHSVVTSRGSEFVFTRAVSIWAESHMREPIFLTWEYSRVEDEYIENAYFSVVHAFVIFQNDEDHVLFKLHWNG